MLFLTSTSDLIQLVTGSAVSSIDVQADFLDLQGNSITPGRKNTQITTATTATIVASPLTGIQRNMRGLTVRNASGSNCLVTVQHFDGTITVTMVAVTLNPGDTLQYTTDDGWIVILASGGISTVIASVAAGSITGILALNHGGTGSDLSGTGGAHSFVKQSSLGGNLTVGAIAAADIAAAMQAPQVTVLSSGSGTYNVPAGALYLEVEAVGGGGGGAGSGTAPGAATAGGNTTFGTSLLTANGGGAGTTSGATAAGGTASGGDLNQTGQDGEPSSTNTNSAGGRGGSSAVFAGAGVEGQSGANPGGAAKTNSGSGGGGAGDAGTANTGGGGAAGGYTRKMISSPAASYLYAVGAAGSGGTAGTGGAAGGNGAAGQIVVTAYFQ